MKLESALKAFLQSKANEGIKPLTLQRYRDLWKVWLAYSKMKKLLNLEDWGLEELEKWRSTWKIKPKTHRLHIAQLRTFYRFAIERDWLAKNLAKRLRLPKDDTEPVGPLTSREAKRLVLAAREHSKESYAIALLMLYTGLAIQDASTLPRSAIRGSLLTLRRAKSGELVQVDLPSPVLAALDELPENGPHYFWNGQSNRAHIARAKRETLKLVADKAGLKGFHPHRLRHTFAVRLLGSGEITMEQLSTLMGHKTIQTTESYYASWDPTRQSLLVRKLRKANAKDRLLREL